MADEPDRFDAARRTWVANDRIARDVRLLVEQRDLDPALVEAVEDALQADDSDALDEALADFLEALREAGE